MHLDSLKEVTCSDLFIDKLEKIFMFHPIKEWMGTVIYNIEGDVMSKMKIHLIDFVPLMRGTIVTVSVDYSDPDIVAKEQKYTIEKYLGVPYGLIHRHPDSVFISGTDRKEIDTKLKNKHYENAYVSVVVNAYGDVLVSYNILGTTEIKTTKITTIGNKKFKRNSVAIVEEVITSELTINVSDKFSKIEQELITEFNLKQWKVQHHTKELPGQKKLHPAHQQWLEQEELVHF